jgi:hypothetical protein
MKMSTREKRKMENTSRPSEGVKSALIFLPLEIVEVFMWVWFGVFVIMMGTPMSVPVWLAVWGDALLVDDLLFVGTDVVMKDDDGNGDVEMGDAMDV